MEGVFSRAFSSQVQPVELARKLAKEMDAHRAASVSRVYVPNQYTVWLSAEDRQRLEGYERSLEQELSGYLLEHARRHDYALLTRPEVNLETDERLRLGEFGIQTRLVKPPARQGEDPSQGEHGHTMVYTRSAQAVAPGAAAPRHPAGRDQGDRQHGRSPLRARRPGGGPGSFPTCDCVFSDPNISREHAELRRGSTGDWQIVDLGSTNGIKVNDRRVDSARLSPGDEVTLGTTRFTFDIEQ